MTDIVVGAAARLVLLRSLEPVLRAVGASIGPDGRPSLYEGGSGSAPREAWSGSAIASAIADDCGAWSVAPRILRETLHQAERDLGDGTARLGAMIGAMVRTGVRCISAGVPCRRLADALLALRAPIDASLEARARLLDEASDDRHRVVLAAGAPMDLMPVLSDVIRTTGDDGSIDVVRGCTPGVTTRVGTGFVFDCSPLGAHAPEAVRFDPVFVLVADDIVEDFGALVPVLEGFASRGKALVVVARDIRDGALAVLERNRREGGLRVSALRPQAVAQEAADSLEDLAIATGATLVADRFGTTMKALRPAMLGRAKSFSLGRREAVFCEPAGDCGAIALRARSLAVDADKARYLALDRERLLRRRARLRGAWAEIGVAGDTDRRTEVLLTVTRAAIASLRSAEASGTVAGGGLVLADVAHEIEERSAAGSFSAERAAAACAAAGLRQIRIELQRNSIRDRTCDATAAQTVGAVDPLDPLGSTQAIVARALSCAATLLLIDNVVSA